MPFLKILFYLIFFFSSINILGQGYLCAIGGGSEDYNSWSDTPYSWIVEKSDSGKVLILSYSDQSDWLPNYFESLGAIQAENLKISSRSIANLDTTYKKIMEAKAIFIKGGDQWKYVTYWKGTKTEKAIKEVFNSSGVIAGTSAGAMILSEFSFSAKFGSVYPDETLINPLSNSIHIENDFLNLKPSVLFDTHFIQRGRFGRLIAFIYNIEFNFNRSVLGIGIDDKTAICIDNDNVGYVYGSGSVAIFQSDSLTSISGTNSEYSIRNLKCDQLLHNWTFDFNSKAIKNYTNSTIQIDQSREFELPKTDIWLSGSNDLRSNINNGIGSFLDSVDAESLGLIYNKNYEADLTELINYLNQNSFNYSQIPLESNLDSAAILDKINTSTCFIIAGDNFEQLMYLADSTTSIGKSFNEKINARIPVYLVGDVGKLIGENYIGKTDTDENASYYGIMTNNNGLNLFGEVIYQPRVFETNDYFENRASSVLFGLVKNKKRIGIYSWNSSFMKLNQENNSIVSEGEAPLVIIDASKSTIADFSHYATNRTRTRQTVGINNLRYTISNSMKNYNYTDVIVSSVYNFNNHNNLGDEFSLSQNYPNPFNPYSIINFKLNNRYFTTLKVYDVVGNYISTLVEDNLYSGSHYVTFDGSNLSSGVYFYRLTAGSLTLTKRMVLVK